MNIVGTLRGATHLPAGAAASFCRWRLVAGPSWQLLGGAAAGATQTAGADRARGAGARGLLSALAGGAGAATRGGGGAAAWEHPIDAHFGAGDVAGWPRLVVTVWTVGDGGRADVAGYGSALVPVAPGEHALEVACWRPEGSALQELRAAFTGAAWPQLTDEATVADPARAPRSALVTATSVAVEVELAVVLRGFAERGIVT